MAMDWTNPVTPKDLSMAETGDAHPVHEVQPHEATYSWFTGLMKTGTIVTVIVTMFVIFLIAS